MKINYCLDKETKGTYRFAPDAGGQEIVGYATIYLLKDFCRHVGIKPENGITITIEPKSEA